MFNFKIANGDITFDGQNNIVMIEDDNEDMLQCITENLSTNKGEWFLDDESGLDRYNILGQKYDPEQVTNYVSEAIFQEPRVDKIESLELDFDRKSRKLSVKFEIIKTSGETVTGEVEV